MKTDNLTGNNKILADIVLVAGILIAALLLYLIYSATGSPAAKAVISLDGKVIGEYPLSEDLDLRIDTGAGGYNDLVIKAGVCYLTDANCPDKLCVKQGHISEAGRSIICLPHKLIITVKGENSESEVDSVAN